MRYNCAVADPAERRATQRSAGAEISSAIANRHLLAFSYGDYPRIVEPHTFGIIRGGRHALCGFQVGGGSQSGQGIGWKTFYVADMSGPTELKRSFARPRPEYRKGDRGFATILTEL